MTSSPFHLLAKPTGAVCNLDCTYCFFLSKDALYPGQRLRMSDETLDAYLEQLLDAHPDGEVAVAWQGGEPTLMGLPFFRRAIEVAERAARPGQVLQHTIQTNGTLIDDEWAAFFAEHGFLVGLSIDGPRQMHDAYRVWKNGRGSFDDVIRAFESAARARGRGQHPVHAARGERGASTRGVPVLPRRARGPLPPVHPDHRARHRADARARQPGMESARRRASGCSTRRQAPW